MVSIGQEPQPVKPSKRAQRPGGHIHEIQPGDHGRGSCCKPDRAEPVDKPGEKQGKKVNTGRDEEHQEEEHALQCSADIHRCRDGQQKRRTQVDAGKEAQNEHVPVRTEAWTQKSAEPDMREALYKSVDDQQQSQDAVQERYEYRLDRTDAGKGRAKCTENEPEQEICDESAAKEQAD